MAAWLTFVVVGGGATGVELAGALGEIARDTLRHDFRAIDPAAARIVLVEAGARLLAGYPPTLSARTVTALARLGVTVRLRTTVVDVAADGVILRAGERAEALPARTVLWAAGVQASPLGGVLARTAGAELDRAGRVIVAPDLTLPGQPRIVVIGDLAHCRGADGSPLPGVAQVAIQQGRHAARLIGDRLRGRVTPPFHYRDLGNLATIGRNEAVADLPHLRASGRFAWLLWLFIHLMSIVQFHNRLLVLTQWAWNYLTRNRAARLITGAGRLPFPPA